jgi:UDP-glucose 4-epimerase
MAKLIITGGCGFIGSHLTELLLSKGHEIIIIDNLSTGYKSNIDLNNPAITFFEVSVESFDLQSLEGIEGVFHLAAQASVPYSVRHFYESSSTNVLSTLKVIDFCSKEKIPMVYATSSAVYGNLPVGDENGDIELLSPYSVDKYIIELYTSVSFKLYKLRSFGLRFFNVYGPRQDPKNPYSGVISLFADKLIKGEPITINGGYQTRDFIFVKDVAYCIYESYIYLLKNEAAKIGNVLTGNSISIDELVGHLSRILNVVPECIYVDLPTGDPAISLGTTEVIEDLLNLRCNNFLHIESGLVQIIEYLKNKNKVIS